MKVTYIIQNKLKASFLLFIVLLVVLLNNIQERYDSEKINGLVTSIYKDRLVVEKFNYNLLDNMYKIISLKDEDHIAFENSKELKSIIYNTENVLIDYNNTYLTKEEKKNLNNISRLTLQMKLAANKNDYITCKRTATEALPILNQLSTIQVSEGKAIKTDADKLFSSSKLSSEFELVMIIVIGLILQALVFSSKTLNIPPSSKHQLN